MECSVSALQQRTTSFNPEATAFNPVFSSPVPQDIGADPVTSPTPAQDPTSTFPMAPTFNCERSPLTLHSCLTFTRFAIPYRWQHVLTLPQGFSDAGACLSGGFHVSGRKSSSEKA